MGFVFCEALSLSLLLTFLSLSRWLLHWMPHCVLHWLDGDTKRLAPPKPQETIVRATVGWSRGYNSDGVVSYNSDGWSRVLQF
jgi:hypothetical protein